jgi:hypothetical protein
MKTHEPTKKVRLIPTIANAAAEQCAQDIAAILPDMTAAQARYEKFIKTHPLKRWEALALQSRAIFLSKSKA